MTLHETWLAETARAKGGFRGNLMAVANILQGKSPTTAEDTRLTWQSVFLLIPVISPFREVISEIQLLLIEHKAFGKLFKQKFPATLLQHWVRQAIGTVHTFQGKQADVVFFVLGADKTTLGAIEWASRKPNLLNVAVTRAKSRFYIIGDYNLWKSWPYFEVAAKKLARCIMPSRR